jgi:3-oxoacyl-[acyl-carrier-protein] synthase III
MRELAFITSIAYYLGSLKPIDEIDFLRDNPEKLAFYRLAGFSHFAQSDVSMRELAHHSAAQTLADSGIPHEDIGICLYVAESFDRDEPVNSSEVNRLLLDLGLANTLPIHISVSNCANIMAALRIAAALIEAGQARHVLVASVDKASRKYGGRRMFQEISVKSDVSVSCIVSGSRTGSYAMLYLGQHNEAALVDVGMEDSVSYAMPKFKGIRHAAKKAREVLGLCPTDFAKIITNNYSREVTKMFIELCGFRKEAGCFENISRFAHAVAGDVLINLKDMDLGGAIKPGDRVFLMADSVTSVSVLCLQRR